MITRVRSGAWCAVRCAALFSALAASGCAQTPAAPPPVVSDAAQTESRPPKTIGDQGPLCALLPGLAAAPAPDFVRLGLRLSYRVHTATVAGSGKDWKPDENGAWQTDDGRRWTPHDKGSNAAEGIMQFDVVALTRTEAAVLATFYLIPRPGDAPRMAFQYPLVGPAANVGGLWASPDKLRSLRNRVGSGVKVQRMPCKVGAETRPAVWVQTSTDTGTGIYAYDEEAGVLLHDSTAGVGRRSEVIGPDETSNTPSTTLADGTLIGRRVVARPWDGASPAAWVASAGPEVYTGTSTVPTAGGAPLVLQQELSVSPKDRGAGWVLYGTALRTTNRLGMPPITTPAEALSGLGQFGGAWAPPEALAGLSLGRKLDTDPETGIETTIAEANDRYVVIRAANRAQTVRWTYDRAKGAMIGLEKDDPTPLGPIRTRLTLRSAR